MSIRITTPEPDATPMGRVVLRDARGGVVQTARVLRGQPAMIWVEVDGTFRAVSSLPDLLQRLLAQPALNVGTPAAPATPVEPQK